MAKQPLLIAPCGINCALCANYLSQINNLKIQGIQMSQCMGCRPRGKQCAFKKHCPKLNGENAFCFECADFPCHRLKTLDARYRSRYHTSPIENLYFIKENGVERFLEVQAQKWRCPTCGDVVCCHNGLCFRCDLEKLRAKKKKLC
jgi:hypothetical protein